MKYQTNPGDKLDLTLFMWAGFVTNLTAEQIDDYLKRPTIASEEAAQFLTQYKSWSTKARATQDRKVAVEPNTKVILRNDDGTKKTVNPGLWEQYSNADQKPIVLEFKPSDKVEGEHTAEGPAERFGHDISIRSIGTITVQMEGVKKELMAYVKTTKRWEHATPDVVGVMKDLVIAINSETMVGLNVWNDGTMDDLAESFRDIRIDTQASKAIRVNIEALQATLTRDDLSGPRREQLKGVLDNHLAAYLPPA